MARAAIKWLNYPPIKLSILTNDRGPAWPAQLWKGGPRIYHKITVNNFILDPGLYFWSIINQIHTPSVFCAEYQMLKDFVLYSCTTLETELNYWISTHFLMQAVAVATRLQVDTIFIFLLPCFHSESGAWLTTSHDGQWEQDADAFHRLHQPCTRAGNKPSQSLKFQNNGEGPY